MWHLVSLRLVQTVCRLLHFFKVVPIYFRGKYILFLLSAFDCSVLLLLFIKPLNFFLWKSWSKLYWDTAQRTIFPADELSSCSRKRKNHYINEANLARLVISHLTETREYKQLFVKLDKFQQSLILFGYR